MGLFDRFKKKETPKPKPERKSVSPREGELQPCPVCGAKAIMDHIGGNWVVGCPDFTVFDKVHKVGEKAPASERFRFVCTNEDEAIKTWNERVDRWCREKGSK